MEQLQQLKNQIAAENRSTGATSEAIATEQKKDAECSLQATSEKEDEKV